MVATETELNQAIHSYLSRAQSVIRVERAILFGSYARGEPDDWSDIDLAIISPDFEGMPFWKRQSILGSLTAGFDPRLAPVGYPSSEYRNPSPHSFLREILRTGQAVYEAPQS